MSQDIELKPRIRASEKIDVTIPLDTLSNLRSIAAERDMSLQGLLKFYIGNGLRSDLARRYILQLLARTEEVLNARLETDEATAILREIREDVPSPISQSQWLS